MHRTYRWIGLLYAITVFAGWAHAQQAPLWQIHQMKVAIWPEYDDPRVFVTYSGKLEGEVTLPIDVRFLVPKGAEVTHACGLTPSGEHQCRLPRFTEQPGGVEVSYSLPTREFLIEMYYDPSTSGATVRNFEFPFTATYPFQQLTVEVQKPLRSTDFQVEPTALTTSSDSRGFQYYQKSYPNVQPGQEIATKVSYTKTDNNPSIKPEAGATSGTTARTNLSSQAPLIVGIVMVGLIALALGAYWVRSTAYRTQHPVPNKGASPKSSKIHFCPSCGEKVSAQHKFCTNCGQSLGG